MGDDVIGSAGRNGRRRQRRRLEVGAVLAVINGVMVGVGGVYATTLSVTVTVVAAVAAVVLAGLIVLAPVTRRHRGYARALRRRSQKILIRVFTLGRSCGPKHREG